MSHTKEKIVKNEMKGGGGPIIQKESHWELENRIFHEPYIINFANISLSHSVETLWRMKRETKPPSFKRRAFGKQKTEYFVNLMI
jgi:hypothetical protein